jgi:hypothetical protein
MHATLVIPARFCGPPDSGNGGFTAGSLAALLDGPGEVTLRTPPPLERPLAVERVGDELRLVDGDVVVAEAKPATVDLLAPPPVAVDEARAAEATSRFRQAPGEHPFPTCFVCGTDRHEGDGLRLFPGRLPGRDEFAVPWTPAAEFGDDDGLVRTEIVWSALDCPSSFAMYMEEDPLPGPYVLGRLAVRIASRPRVLEDHVVLGWRVGVDGRKLFAGSALYDAHGTVLAVAGATWISIATA